MSEGTYFSWGFTFMVVGLVIYLPVAGIELVSCYPNFVDACGVATMFVSLPHSMFLEPLIMGDDTVGGMWFFIFTFIGQIIVWFLLGVIVFGIRKVVLRKG